MVCTYIPTIYIYIIIVIIVIIIIMTITIIMIIVTIMIVMITIMIILMIIIVRSVYAQTIANPSFFVNYVLAIHSSEPMMVQAELDHSVHH